MGYQYSRFVTFFGFYFFFCADQLGIASSPRLSFSREVSEMGYFGGDRDDNGFDLDVPGEDSSRPFATDL